MTLAELWDALASHDWFWPMTDDPRVSACGRGAEERLRSAAVELPGGAELFWAFKGHYSIGSSEGPLPERPTGIMRD